MKAKIVIGMWVMVAVVCISRSGFSWDDDVTHRDLSRYAAEQSVLDKAKGDYLRDLGFSKGLEEKLAWGKKKFIKEWLAEGALKEDEAGFWHIGYFNGKARALNHFHNPLKVWDEAGLDDWFGVLGPFKGKSSVLWAQDGDHQKDCCYEGDWSWKKVREHFYAGLTGRDFSGQSVALEEAKRKEYFARAFRGLGHQMHLVQDAAQPDHVRNDIHAENSIPGKSLLYGSPYFENWTANAIKGLDKLKAFAPAPLFPAVSLDVSKQDFVPITQLIDTDGYAGTNPSATLAQGAAEYANANFFSDDTMFAHERYAPTDKRYFPYPRRSSTDLQDYLDGKKPVETVVAQDGKKDTAVWISKVGDGEEIKHFIRPSVFTYKVYNKMGEGALFYWTFYRDEICHEEYAKRLLPRAVGYSAALINYFFRGKLAFMREGDAVRFKNLSDEPMESGTIELYYDDNSPERVRKQILQIALADPLGPGQTTDPVSFSPPTDNMKSDRYIAVFRGKLGAEKEAVAGKINRAKVVFGRDNGGGGRDLWMMDADGGNLRKIEIKPNPPLSPSAIPATALFTKPHLSPDGSQISFISDWDGMKRLWIANVDGTEPRPLVEAVQNGGFSPDGNEVVITRVSGVTCSTRPEGCTVYNIYVYTLATGAVRQLTFAQVPGMSKTNPAWSPDGKWIAYNGFDKVSGEDPACNPVMPDGSQFGHRIWRIPPQGGASKKLSTCVPWPTPDFSGDQHWFPSWSPDSKRIAFWRVPLTFLWQWGQLGTSSYAHLRKIPAGGHLVASLASVPIPAVTRPFQAREAPLLAAAVSPGADPDDLFVVGVDGQSQERLTDTLGISESFTAWMPEGDALLVRVNADGGQYVSFWRFDLATKTYTQNLIPSWSGTVHAPSIGLGPEE